MANRCRQVELKLYVSEQEKEIIESNMALLGTKNFSQYARKMLCDGYVVKRNFDYLKEYTRELGYIAKSLNMLVRRANATGSIYKEDFKSISLDYRKIRVKTTKTLSRILDEEKIKKREKV